MAETPLSQRLRERLGFCFERMLDGLDASASPEIVLDNGFVCDGVRCHIRLERGAYAKRPPVPPPAEDEIRLTIEPQAAALWPEEFDPDPSLDAVFDVMEERARQVVEEGLDRDSDDVLNNQGQLAYAAACYATGDVLHQMVDEPGRRIGMRMIWPWDRSWWKPDPVDRRRDLVKAGALILAEIERLDGIEARSEEAERCDTA
jgi:hypothetical protein